LNFAEDSKKNDLESLSSIIEDDLEVESKSVDSGDEDFEVAPDIA